MIPESIMHGYFRLSSESELRLESLLHLIRADAGLLSFWLNTLKCSAEPKYLRKLLKEMDSRDIRRIMQSHLLLLQSSPVQRNDLDWQHHLQLSFLAHALASSSQQVYSDANQPRALLALSGFEIPRDPTLKELFEFRYAAPELLVDAHPLLRAFVCVSQNSVEDSEAIAKLLFGMDAQHYAKIAQQATSRCDQHVSTLELITPAPDYWRDELRRAVQLGLYSETLARQDSVEQLLEAYGRICIGLFRVVPECFVVLGDGGPVEQESQRLQSLNYPEFSISVADSPSMVATSARTLQELAGEDGHDTYVVDRQILRRLSTSRARMLPLKENSRLLGVLVFPDDMSVTEQTLVERRSSAKDLSFWLNNFLQDNDQRNRTLENYRDRHEKQLREIVHEANNPLSIINNYLHILELRLQNESGAKDQLHMIGEEIRRTSDIIKRVIEIPQLEQGDSNAQRQSFERLDLNELVIKVAELTRGFASESGIKIKTDISELGLSLHSDSDSIKQMLINLAKNAIEAMRELGQGDQVVFETRANVIRDGVQGMEVVVRDNGPGLPEKVLEALYEPKDFTRGSGLGLHITATLLHALHGAMDVRSSARGSAFYIFLPKNG